MEGHLRYLRSLGKTWKTISWKLSFPKAMRTFRAMSLVVKVDPSSSVVRLYRFHLCVNSEISGSRVHGTQWVSKNQRKWYVRFREKTDENFETPKWSVGHLEQPTLICLFQLGQHLGACKNQNQKQPNFQSFRLRSPFSVGVTQGTWSKTFGAKMLLNYQEGLAKTTQIDLKDWIWIVFLNYKGFAIIRYD